MRVDYAPSSRGVPAARREESDFSSDNRLARWLRRGARDRSDAQAFGTGITLPQQAFY